MSLIRSSYLNRTVIALNLTREFNMITFENALELVSQLPREQQEMLIESWENIRN
jgi:hypothetical protein